MAGPRACDGVLVVDDDADIRGALVEFLREEGYRVLDAPNGAEALRELRQAVLPPCLILLDLMMPIMDGWEFREEQSHDPAISEIPVLLLTADGAAQKKAETLKASGALAKPLDLDVLLAHVERFCGGSA